MECKDHTTVYVLCCVCVCVCVCVCLCETDTILFHKSNNALTRNVIVHVATVYLLYQYNTLCSSCRCMIDLIMSTSVLVEPLEIRDHGKHVIVFQKRNYYSN